MESFSKKVKTQIENDEIKKKCCRRIFTSILELRSEKKNDLTDKISEIYKNIKCENCTVSFLKAIFVLYGSVTDPEKTYHLDFSFSHERMCELIESVLADFGCDFKRTVRKDKFVLYIKDSSAIEEFFVSIGANAAAFDIMNVKIVHEFRNSVNRQVNCDTANIEKQLQAVKKYTDAIGKLIETGKIDSLPTELRETAVLRYENDQLSLTDLGKLLNPQVSKSGIKHRLDKILALAEELLKTD
ncbi:MAG: DNA-binding protein WhiA [Ruminococcaceae bacterium]|nr:DNA-binding protein WhiA [Oscillospiraceae bacterium]